MSETIRLAGCVNDSIVDGPGIRFAIFTQGCPHHCNGCHNQHTHDFDGGYEEDIDNILAKIFKNPLLDGITLTGGEPFAQAKKSAQIAKSVSEKGLSVVTYTGYTFEELIEKKDTCEGFSELLCYTDILIDGKFEKDLKSLDLNWRGSKNQRILDCKKSLETMKAVERDI